MEVMAAELPIICSSRSGNTDLVQNGNFFHEDIQTN